MDIKIESNIPLPKSRTSRKYPYENMAVNDSFFVTDVTMPTLCNLNSRYGKRFNAKYVARKEGEGIRVWRTE